MYTMFSSFHKAHKNCCEIMNYGGDTGGGGKEIKFLTKKLFSRPSCSDMVGGHQEQLRTLEGPGFGSWSNLKQVDAVAHTCVLVSWETGAGGSGHARRPCQIFWSLLPLFFFILFIYFLL